MLRFILWLGYSIILFGDIMRVRNLKNKNEILDNSSYVVKNPAKYKGCFNKLFGNDNPICVEIGSGKCSFIYEMARQNPDCNYIGVEVQDSILAIGVREISKLPKLDNLYLIKYDALKIDEVFDGEVDTLYLNFSDPWPKKRHEKRRLTNFRFLEKYDIMFLSDKKIVMKTDNEGLFEYSVVSLSKYGYKIIDLSLDLHKREDYNNIMTEYERKFSSKGSKIYMLSANKKVLK